ncbi:hypothetical protein ECC02_010619 [Trypanosoma cruzi]|uniref:Uncharacterized protein n=1 Tax=Trypanosoma cruzi TaxID=5693 RepID=A0A7J6XQ16_TRYCR|nr:hypothetical protein ECC02_010619 [Trypanosoma cruzi]
MCAKSTATVIVRGGHHGTVRHAPAHTEQSTQPAVQIHSCRALCNYLCVWVSVGEAEEEHREAHQHSKRHSWMAEIHAVRPNLKNHTRWQHTPKKKKKKNTAAGCGCVCMCGAAGVCPPWPQKKTKQEGKKCVLRPTGPRRTPTRHGSLSAPFVAAPPHACSRRGAQGRRHERVGGCASGAVGRETHGTPHRKSAEETIKEGRVEKKKRP